MQEQDLPSIDILFATHNGEDTLGQMLQAFQRLTPMKNFRVLAVDNASTDTTLAILKQYEALLPLTILTEPRPGKNCALNRGLSVSRADVVILTDDDVIPCEDWLLRYAHCAAQEPDFALFGGAVSPRWPTTPPAALLDNIPLASAYAKTSDDLQAGPSRAMAIFGPNMAVRRSVFDAGVRFNEAVGPAGRSYAMGSESDFLLRAEQEGFRAWFDPENSVEHLIAEEQLTDRWLAGRAFKAGRGMIHKQRLAGELNTNVARLFGYPRWCFKKQLEQWAGLQRARARRKDADRYRLLWEYNVTRGYAHEFRLVFGTL